MQAGDLKLLMLGVFSVGFLGYYFKKYTKEQQNYRLQVQQFTKCYQESQKNQYQHLNQIMTVHNQLNNKGEKVTEKPFCFMNIQPRYNSSTFSLYERQRSMFQKYAKYPNSEILQHQMGGDFSFDSNNAKITCQLNDFCLSGELLYEKQKTPVNIFKGINKIEPIVCTVLTVLKTMNLSIYGKLSYDNNQATWTVEPFFLTPANSLKSTIEQYYKQKLQFTSYVKFAIFVSSLIITYFTIFQSLKSLFKKKKTNYIAEENDIQFFKNKQYISVKGENLLNCQSCKNQNVEMIYECGHLVLCKQCHEKNNQKICPFCQKVSKRFMKIFMA